MTTYLTPVAMTIEDAKKVARSRGRAPNRPGYPRDGSEAWHIRKGYDGFYVVPGWDRGYDFLGSFVTAA